ncbi:MFS transporter [Listeria booriae]|nr:MFS transporter [Listeria booriae]MBC2024072.1 MFS transporter [Listeria booriae]MBC2031450.1 MFS transporter [Listeria booriae]MBC2263878.1 MFS transporter [Listeria booriae]
MEGVFRLKGNRNIFALLALAVSAFAIGTTEFISVGLLPLIAEDLAIPVSTAGLTVSLYAVGVMFGAPILTALTSRMNRKTLLLAIMIVFILGNTIAAFSTTIALLLIARVVSAFAHGVFMSIGSTIAADLVPPNKRASAISIMFTGLTIATVTGVPIGTLVGQQFGWRTAFIGIAALGVIALIANLILIPRNLRPGAKMTLSEQVKVLTTGPLLLVFAITALGYGGTFVVFTYLTPLLEQVTGFPTSTVALLLFIYGIAIAVGNSIGGKVANKRPIQALFYMFIAQAVVLGLLYFTAPSKVFGLATILLMGIFAFMNVPGLQVYVVILAEKFVPKGVDIASALNIAAFNAGIALGSYLGGLVITHMRIIDTTWVGMIMVLIAVALTAWSKKLETKQEEF